VIASEDKKIQLRGEMEKFKVFFFFLSKVWSRHLALSGLRSIIKNPKIVSFSFLNLQVKIFRD